MVTVLVSSFQLLSVARHLDQEPLAGRCVDLGLDLTSVSSAPEEQGSGHRSRNETVRPARHVTEMGMRP